MTVFERRRHMRSAQMAPTFITNVIHLIPKIANNYNAISAEIECAFGRRRHLRGAHMATTFEERPSLCAPRRWRRRSKFVAILTKLETAIFTILIWNLQFAIGRWRHLRGAHMATTFV